MILWNIQTLQTEEFLELLLSKDIFPESKVIMVQALNTNDFVPE